MENSVIELDEARIRQAFHANEPVSSISLPLESVTVFPLVGNTLYACESIRENKLRNAEGLVVSTETKKELAFLAGKCQSWPIGKPELARDYNVKQAATEQAEAPHRIFESPAATITREMLEEAGYEWPEWKKFVSIEVLHVTKDKDKAESYMLLVFIHYPDESFITHANYKLVGGPEFELGHFLPLPYSFSGGCLTVEEPQGYPPLRKFFKNILFRFYGALIYTNFRSRLPSPSTD